MKTVYSLAAGDLRQQNNLSHAPFREKFPLCLDNRGERMHGRRVAFPREVTTAEEARRVLVEMVREARAKE